MEIGFIGLGKMGMNMVTRLQRDRHRVVVYDRSADLIKQAEAVGCVGATSLADLVGVFNGDMGWISRIKGEEGELTLDFDGKQINYYFSELDEVVLAYAFSVHKSQGSEYPAVILPVMTQHYLLLQRNLIYTGITRSKKLAVLVGTKKALTIAIKKTNPR